MIREACVETFKEAVKAEKSGADRIELCSNLSLDGLTPSYELMKKACSSLQIPVMIMIRPRGGDFIYEWNEIIQMKSEIDKAKSAGAFGVVFGLLNPDFTIDEENTRDLAEYAYPLEVTFHKAIDELDDPAEGVKILRNIKGITRILTSGGKPTAMEGLAKLKQMMKIAGKKPVILVAGKVTSENVEEISQLTGTLELHGRRIVGDLTL